MNKRSVRIEYEMVHETGSARESHIGVFSFYSKYTIMARSLDYPGLTGSSSFKALSNDELYSAVSKAKVEARESLIRKIKQERERNKIDRQISQLLTSERVDL